jgi:hypothetical protein
LGQVMVNRVNKKRPCQPGRLARRISMASSFSGQPLFKL